MQDKPRMKNPQLKDVMNSLRIVMLEDGYELHNEAGSAKYDAYGIRGEVHGIPEYFPLSLSVSEANAGGAKPAQCVYVISAEGEPSDFSQTIAKAASSAVKQALATGGFLRRRSI